VRDFVWADLRGGTISLRGLPAATQSLAALGFGPLFAMVGALLSVTLINWALAPHNLTETGNLGGDMALIGFNRFGKPMLYAIYVATLRGKG
jgi:hypothetical protein